ncbi:MAG: T9SS type A sorting domain-containing protein, partial [Ignavibacteriaceae bacterium]|nr:T9SS type A sorting domain-containing protein [Ignavibacteriaceae bacterium]
LNRYQEAGSYDVIFQAKDLASGIYFYTLTSGNFTATKKLILLK